MDLLSEMWDFLEGGDALSCIDALALFRSIDSFANFIISLSHPHLRLLLQILHHLHRLVFLLLHQLSFMFPQSPPLDQPVELVLFFLEFKIAGQWFGPGLLHRLGGIRSKNIGREGKKKISKMSKVIGLVFDAGTVRDRLRNGGGTNCWIPVPIPTDPKNKNSRVIFH